MTGPPHGDGPCDTPQGPANTRSGAAAGGPGALPWHLRRATEALHTLDVNPDTGLDPDEAARRLELYGANELRSAPPVPLWRKVLRQFQDPLIYLLLAAIVISVLAWAVEGAAGVPVTPA